MSQFLPQTEHEPLNGPDNDLKDYQAMCILHNIQDHPFISFLGATGMVFPILTLKDSVLHCWSLLSQAALVLLLTSSV